ncbi:(deoxy)nucleoside triphosphate pyrophosphohydrolase [Microbacterium esteraromaticum]|uniref:(deoxy)nucleoside triphosphate pyrophosphohydrolase n=1 Tax=Microbacterium esteraromaticum TaxID=57043 RepID=UPI001D36191C|nr:8-oxo-dGTP diphosphatase [Microbacterium esteraromaticum]
MNARSPHHASGLIDVVGAVIARDSTVLAARRGHGRALEGMWEFPGGKVETNETHRSALEREILEELGCGITIGDHIVTTTHAYPFGAVRLSTYYAVVEQGRPRPSEHAALQWVEISRLMELNWAPADVPAVRKVISQSQASR